jgi:hypothetical protein
MSNEIRSCIEGEFNGFDEANVYRLENGKVYQQTAHHYHYHYAYRPRVRIFHNGSGVMLEVEGLQGAVPVAEVSCLEEGAIVSDFKGFEGESVFQFQNGHVWKQTEYKYDYHYAYRPEATVVDGINGPELHVEGMEETVRVRRIR